MSFDFDIDGLEFSRSANLPMIKYIALGLSSTAPTTMYTGSASVGVSTSAARSDHIHGNPITTTQVSLTLSNLHQTILVNNTSGSNLNVSLPSASTYTGKIYYIKKIDASDDTVTVVGVIDGTSNYTLSTQNQSVILQSDGTNWWKLN